MKPLVIFDCDGVLVDSETIASAVFAGHLAAIGLPYTAEDCRQHFTGLSLATCRKLLEQVSGVSLPDHFFVNMQHETFARFARELSPIAGIREVLEHMQAARWPCCVASSGSAEKMALTLGKTGLQQFFGHRVFSASEVARGKPAPDLFLHAAERLGFRPQQCIVIEDSLPGIEAGLAAGMAVCAFGAGHVAARGVFTFSDMSELPAILDSLSTLLASSREP